VFLHVADGHLFLIDGARRAPLPDGALEATFERFGRPLDEAARLTDVAELVLPTGRRLRRVRHLARFDVIARDWLVLDASEEDERGPGRAALATTIAGALEHLAGTFARAQERAAGPLSGS